MVMVYKFNKEIREQKGRGTIGMNITGVIAQIFMTWWDKKLVKKLNVFEIKPCLSKHYVDDININFNPVYRLELYEQTNKC